MLEEENNTLTQLKNDSNYEPVFLLEESESEVAFQSKSTLELKRDQIKEHDILNENHLCFSSIGNATTIKVQDGHYITLSNEKNDTVAFKLKYTQEKNKDSSVYLSPSASHLLKNSNKLRIASLIDQMYISI